MQNKWVIEYFEKPAMNEGFAILLVGPESAEAERCLVMAQTIPENGSDKISWDRDDASHATTEITLDEARDIHTSLSEARINLFPPFVWGYDGGTNRLTLHAGFNESRFAWFMLLPDCWKELEPAIEKLSSLATACLGQTGTSSV